MHRGQGLSCTLVLYFIYVTVLPAIEFTAEELKHCQGRKLGSGGFGTVYHGNVRGSAVAIKYLNEVWTSAKLKKFHFVCDSG